jgi:two-component system, OmpR family, sensor kinase
MTLRLRMVIALVALAAVGLGVFGVVTYSFYSRSLHDRLDQQLRSSVALVSQQLRAQAGLGNGGDGGNGGGSGGSGGSGTGSAPNEANGGGLPPKPPVVVPPGTYGELRDESGTVVSRVQLSNRSTQPKLPNDLPSGPGEHLFSTGSVSGSTRWRGIVVGTDNPTGDSVVVAVPLSEVNSSLHRFVLIEAAAAAGLLLILAVGSWLILRRGLRPLEHMATQARSITAGDLSQRVEADARTEVGQLGLALNTMLSEIEDAFRARAATEFRLRQFLADVSHELRTPLTSIQGFAELFRLGADQDRVQLAVILRRIEEETARMKTLVDDLLLLARLDETRPAERQPVDLAVLAADACSDAVAVAPDRRITLDAPVPVVVLGDRDHLRQAIANLVANALLYTPAGSPIEVGADIVDGGAVVTVRDHGPGLGVDALEHGFDRFWRADEARVGTGSGLGLSIVAGIAEEHSGAASVVNETAGGARFTLQLPLSAPAPPGLRKF